mgnify:CR=1 FL=1
MKKTLYFLSLLIFANCSVAQNSGIKLNKRKLKNSIKSFITSHLQSNYKPILDNKILQKSTNSTKNLSDYFTTDYFYLIHKLNVKSKEEIIKFDEFFSEDEFKSMKVQIQNNKHKKWTEFFNNQDVIINAVFKINDSIIKDLSKFKSWGDISKAKNSKDILSLKSKIRFFSMPVFNKDFSFAIVYIEDLGSGELKVFKHQDNKWVLFGVGGLWTSD